jgi:hypothetical protein
MANIKINNVDYDTESLTDEAKQQLQMLVLTDSEIKRLQGQLAIAQTAKNTFAQALVQAVVIAPQGKNNKP